jgi:hypothetical protein
MKTTKTNGAASQAAKITTQTRPTARNITPLGISRGFARALAADDLAREARRVAAREAVQNGKRTIAIEVDAFCYGSLCAAGVVHDGTPEQVAAAFLQERVTEWSNEDFILRD